MIGKKKLAALVLSVATVAGAMALPAAANTASVSGNVVSFGSTQDPVTLSLYQQGGNRPIAQTTAVNGSYQFDTVAAGLYTLRVEKSGHVTREYALTVQGSALTQDVKLHTQGDVTGDGKINMGDTARAFAHVRKRNPIDDAYILACVDLTQDGKVNIGDVARIYAAVRNPEILNPTIPPIPANPVEDHKDAPVEIGGTLEFQASVQAGHLVYYHLYRISDTSMEIRSPYAYVIYNGETYEAKDGVVTVPGLYTDNPNTPVALAIGNRDTKDHDFDVKLCYPEGHQMNPITLENGSLSTFCEEGNDQGVYYRFVASKAGTLTIRLTSASDCNITITSENEQGGTRAVSLDDNPGSTSLTFAMAEGESAIISIVMHPVNGFNYPEATVTSTVRFR